MLAHQGAKPIPNTIASWANAGILDVAAERIMYTQGPPVPKWNAWLKRVAVQYNFEVVEAQENTVFESLFVLGEACQSTYFMFMEKDWAVAPNINASSAKKQLATAVDMIGSGLVHGVRFRHVRFIGQPHWEIVNWRKAVDATWAC